MADSGSGITILDGKDLSSLQDRPRLSDTTTRVYPYKSKTPLSMFGKFKVTVTTENETISQETIYVAEGAGGSPLSWQASQNFGLISITSPLVSKSRPEINQLVQEYDDLLKGLGKLKDYQIHLQIDDSVQPSAQSHRRVLHGRKQLEEQLERDEQHGVMERVDGPTPWVSPVVVAPKPKQPGKIRMCVDMRQANSAIQRERHIKPTIKEIIAELNGASIMEKHLLNLAYV
ncbi:uncharacterized protein LOC111345583 [Stylophora pistillata]|uniref:uncharacterized protein LOC111345583 n=1 Tax=Stylophora pistillata TaxID=50429 RepID=UPI000C038E15|nr:uncharacterized protein LOC111345583 [Stylophora pistillata]